MLDIMYEIPKDDNIGEVTITGDYINRIKRSSYSDQNRVCTSKGDREGRRDEGRAGAKGTRTAETRASEFL